LHPRAECGVVVLMLSVEVSQQRWVVPDVEVEVDSGDATRSRTSAGIRLMKEEKGMLLDELTLAGIFLSASRVRGD